ncbi:zf-HC2 domain-containing protein [Alloacidobacterium dinghuense]|uniref:Zf-HC2 domain-containing protein n=1 Tax=Alloacidobacterium dinghuense TaxID=2763107 RepID=A0A7G8BCE3_9BACT|nr:zf-HC2 domain-containing protein [Alloacidobacterium dinghuense]QNI30213.1 zf-HC2 domain-containing protein [Alloacidobacterium dinghuense]
MTCTEFIAQLDDLLEERVSKTLRVDLEEHLRTCEHCVITMNTTRKTIEIYRSHELYELPNELRDRLQKAILAKCKKC